MLQTINHPRTTDTSCATEIYNKLTGIFHDVFDDSAIALTPQICAADVSGWDSFNHINLVIAIESAFGIKFSTADLERMSCVGDIVAMIQQKTAHLQN